VIVQLPFPGIVPLKSETCVLVVKAVPLPHVVLAVPAVTMPAG
jgi:hypothetical protein